MRFGHAFIQFIKKWYQYRSSVLSVNGHTTRSFTLTRVMQRGDPIFPSICVIQMTPLCKMINQQRSIDGILVSTDQTLPMGSSCADDSLIIARLPGAACRVYSTAEKYCQGSVAHLHSEKCIAIPVTPSTTDQLPNGVCILQVSQSTTILGIRMGGDITRDQIVNSTISRMMEKSRTGEHKARTHQGRTTIMTSIILSTIWYVLSVLPLNRKKISRIIRVGTQYMSNHRDIQWEGPHKRCQKNFHWFYIEKKCGEWEVTPVQKTL